MNKIEAVKELKDTISEFQNLISSFNEDQFNEIPFEGSWTPGQVAQHIVMANSGFADVLNGPVVQTKRDPDELVGRIKADFLNFDIKMTSPDFINPIFKVYNKERLLEKLEAIKNDLSEAIMPLEMEPICLAFKLPVYGHLTRLESVYFVIYHTMRHAQQLKRIKQHYA